MLSDKLNNEISMLHKKIHYNLKNNDIFFKTSHSSVVRYFYRLLDISNIKHKENTPRIHDFRHTFVVHNFERTIKENKDINTLLPVLKTHLGHQSINALLYYFHLTNNILSNINEISEKELGYLIPELEVFEDE